MDYATLLQMLDATLRLATPLLDHELKALPYQDLLPPRPF